MRHPIAVILWFMAMTAAADAACFADYKAKRDNPLRLHYGVVQLADAACRNRNAAARRIARRIGRDGWTLLSVEGIFDRAGAEARRGDAGQFYLRY